MSRTLIACLLLVSALAGGGCGDQPEHQALPPEKTKLQQRIDSTEAASAVGYDGAALKHDVQGTVDREGVQQSRTQAAMDAASGDAPAPDSEP